MRIAVCIKQVPEREDCGMDPEQGVLIREGTMRMNPWDRYALETALRLGGDKGETTAFTMGPLSAERVLREALAMGVDAGVLVSDRAFAGADVFATSYTLAGAIRLYGEFDAVICGKQTADGDTAQVGAALAAQLNWKYMGCVQAISHLGEGRVGVRQAGSFGIYGAEAGFPLVISVEQDIYIPRVPTLRMRLLAEKKDISLVGLPDMEDSCPEHYGLKGSPTRVLRIYRPKEEKRGTVEAMDAAAGAAALERLLKEQMEKRGTGRWREAGGGLGREVDNRKEVDNREKADNRWKGILVYLQADEEGKLLPVALELANKAAGLAEKTGEEVYGLIAVPEMKDFHRQIPGIGKLFAAVGKQFGRFSNSIAADTVIRCISLCRPSVVLFGATPEGRSIAPPAAVRFGTGLTADCTELHMDGNGRLIQVRPAFGGNVMAEIITPYKRPQMATVRPGVMAAPCPGVKEEYPVEILDIPEVVPAPDQVDQMQDAKADKKAPLAQAEWIVAAGGGLRDKKDMERLGRWAEKNGAVLGCSRKLVERGWLPGECQIGLSGSSVAPKLLITVGVSGSVQFLAGIRRAEYVAAVDCNKDAPIFGRANVGILSDLNEVLSELEKEFISN